VEGLEDRVNDFKLKLQQALSLSLDYPDGDRNRMLLEKHKGKLENFKPAAVLMLFGQTQDEPSLLYTKRTELVETHKGQMAFPGGYCEPEDGMQPEVTALRETYEEVGIPSSFVQIQGILPTLPTISGFMIQPVVGWLSAPIETVKLELSVKEIAETVWIPLKTLRHPNTYHQEEKAADGISFRIHVYQVHQHRIWGATAAITKNLLDRLEQVRYVTH